MAEHRPFAPSARRRALARAAGLHAASPLLVAAGALGAVALAIAAAARAAYRALGTWIAEACQAPVSLARTDALPRGTNITHGLAHAPGATDALAHAAASRPQGPIGGARGLDGDGLSHVQARVGELTRTVLELALPVLAAAALAALIIHVAQTRAVWMPRRSIAGAPAMPPARVRRSAFELATAFVVGGVTLGWLWAMAPRLGALVEHPLAGGLVVTAFLASLAIAYVALGAADALLQHAAHAAALRMTHAEQREDARLAGTDPRWRKARADAARTRAPRSDDERIREAVAGATIVILGDDAAGLAPAARAPAAPAASVDAPAAGALAIAISWDPHRRPVPTRTALGRGARATQLLGLARRYGIPVHRDAVLASALAHTDAAVPEAHWPRLAELVAATRPRG